jgi:hypothetical protein
MVSFLFSSKKVDCPNDDPEFPPSAETEAAITFHRIS